MRRLLRSWLWRVPVKQEVDEEIALHLELRARELVAGGMNPEAARREAARRLGDVAHVKRSCVDIGTRRDREMRLTQWLEEAAHDVKFAARQLRQSPLFAVVAIMTLALGIGVNSAMFGLADAVFLRPLPFPGAGELVIVNEVRADTRDGVRVAPTNFVDWNEQARSFEGLAAIISSGRVAIGPDGAAERVPGLVVTPRYFDLLGTKPIAGRTFAAGDDAPGMGLVVISESYWRNRHGADPALVGRGIQFGDQLLTVIGIIPDQVPMFGPADVWWLFIPAEDRRSRYLQVIGRLRPGATRFSARAEMEQLAATMARDWAATNEGWSADVLPLREALIGPEVRLTSLLLLGVVGFVLLMTCTNIASLLLARTAAREREIAVRAALGAGRRRIARQFLADGLVLSGIGGALGLAIGAALLRAAPAAVPADLLPAPAALVFDRRVALFSLVATGLVGLFFSLAPVWQAGRLAPAEALGGHGRVTASAGRMRSLLVGAEVAAAVLLLCGAGLLGRTLVALQRVDPGYRAQGALTTRTQVGVGGRYRTESDQRQFYEMAERELNTLPAVRRAAWGSWPPLVGTYYGQAFGVLGDTTGSQGDGHASYQMVSAPHFETLGIPVLNGRVFNERDTTTAVQVCIVNDAFVRQYLPDREPIGARISIPAMNTPPQPPVVREIVGVVGHVKERPSEAEPSPQVYVPISQDAWAGATLFVAPVEPGNRTIATEVRATMARIAPWLPSPTLRTLEDIGSEVRSRPRFRAMLVAAFAGLALALAVVGVFGVVAYSVQQRTREFAVRRALGAGRGQVLRIVLRSAARTGLAGSIAGLALAVLLARFVESLLFGVEPLDAATLGAVIGLVILTVLAAAALPAVRASRVDPAAALKDS